MLSSLKEQISILLAWQTRPVAEKKRIIMFVILLAALIPMFTWSWISSSTDRTMEEAQQIIDRYERALPLAVEVMAGNTIQNDTGSGISPLAAAQQITRQMGLEDRMTSIRPSRALQGRDGVQIYMENLNLMELLQLFENLKNQAGLQIVSGNLNKRLDNPQLVDLSLVLAR